MASPHLKPLLTALTGLTVFIVGLQLGVVGIGEVLTYITNRYLLSNSIPVSQH